MKRHSRKITRFLRRIAQDEYMRLYRHNMAILRKKHDK